MGSRRVRVHDSRILRPAPKTAAPRRPCSSPSSARRSSSPVGASRSADQAHQWQIARADRQPWRRRPAAPARGCPRTSPRPPQCWSRSRQRRCRCWGGALRPETPPPWHADAAARARGAGGRGRGSGRAAPSNGGARPPRALAGLSCPKGSPRAARGRALSRRRRRHRKSCARGRLLPRRLQPSGNGLGRIAPHSGGACPQPLPRRIRLHRRRADVETAQWIRAALLGCSAFVRAFAGFACSPKFTAKQDTSMHTASWRCCSARRRRRR